MRYTKEDIDRRIKRVEKTKKFFSILIYIILIPIIIYNIMLIVKAAQNPNETPSVAGIKSFVIISGSMEPELKIGDVVIIKKCNQEDLKVGDIISYRSGQSIITHRIHDIIKKGNSIKYETKGDNNNISDRSFVKFEDIEGKLIQKISNVGNIILLLKNKVVIIAILIMFYIMYLHNINVEEKRILRKEKRRKLKEKYDKKRK
ncbi:MAG: signal peptidase I [Clostridia bacterium]|nr:signal peptidase I [Clostridia bacterium]